MPTDYTTDPVGDDLKAWLLGTGLIKSPVTGALANVDYDGVMLSVVQEWNRATNYRGGFLSDGANKTLYYNPAAIDYNGVLRLQTGLLSLVTLTISGVAKTSGTDFGLVDVNAAAMGQPYKAVQFYSDVAISTTGNPNTVAVTGPIGYAEEWPPDAYEGLLKRGAYKCHTQIALKISGGRAALKADDVQLDFRRSRGSGADGPLAGEAAAWNNEWVRLVLGYRF
jgi:hypothetical protein